VVGVLNRTEDAWRERERRTLTRALLISVLIHLVLFGVMEWAYHAGLTSFSPARSLIENAMNLPMEVRPSAETAREEYRETPLLFVEVDPAQAEETPPKSALYYSSHSTKAANPNPRPVSESPRIEGTQDKVMKTFETLKLDAQPLVPAPVAAAPVETLKPVPEVRPLPRPALDAGNLEFAKAAPQVNADRGMGESSAPSRPPQIKERPRNLAEARQRRGLIEGNAIQQEGGVDRASEVSLLDVSGRSFGGYDAAVVAAVQQRWYDLLVDRQYALERSGRVMLEFRLHHDGRITDMRVRDNDVGDFWALICQKAVEDPSPYAKWPPEMRREIGRDYRDVRFTFHYH